MPSRDTTITKNESHETSTKNASEDGANNVFDMQDDFNTVCMSAKKKISLRRQTIKNLLIGALNYLEKVCEEHDSGAVASSFCNSALHNLCKSIESVRKQTEVGFVILTIKFGDIKTRKVMVESDVNMLYVKKLLEIVKDIESKGAMEQGFHVYVARDEYGEPLVVKRSTVNLDSRCDRQLILFNDDEKLEPLEEIAKLDLAEAKMKALKKVLTF